MDAHKLAAYRYRLIDACLSNRRRRWTLAQLQEYISQKLYEEFDTERGGGLRTLNGDIALMRKDPPIGYGAPIVIKNGTVFYDDAEYSIWNAPLNDKDRQSLRDALHLLRPFNEFPHFAELHLVLRKLEGSTQIGKDLIEKPPLVLFEKNDDLKGRHWLVPLFNHALRREALRIDYQPFNFDRPAPVLFHPYLLKEFNNRWFVLGWNESENALWNLALDRIVQLEPDPKRPFIPNTALDPEAYFRDIIGVTRPTGANVEAVRLRVAAKRAPYILTKPLHTSQQTLSTHPNGDVDIQISLIPNPELDHLLLGFGPDIEVLAPQSLRDQIARLFARAAGLYS